MLDGLQLELRSLIIIDYRCLSFILGSLDSPALYQTEYSSIKHLLPIMDATQITTHEGLSEKGMILMAISWLFTSFAIIIVALRLYLRQKFHRSISLDDWLMVLALIFQILFQIFLTLDCYAGVGWPMATMSPMDIINLTKWSWFTTPGSILASTIARISIAVVFIQVFGNRKWFKHLMISYTVLLTVVGVLNFIFVWVQAKPVQALWDARVPAVYRMDQLPQKIITCILTTIFTLSDLIYTLFPIIFISKLNMTRQRKLELIFFMSGFILTMGIAIGRTAVVFKSLFQKTDVDVDITFVLFIAGSLLASIEQCLVIIIGSIPKLQVAKKLKFPKFAPTFSTIYNRLRYGKSTAASTSNTNEGWAYSDLELRPSAKRTDGSSHPSSLAPVQMSQTIIRKGSQDLNYPGIHVTEGYHITHDYPRQIRSDI